jgi:hypothetical protein
MRAAFLRRALSLANAALEVVFADGYLPEIRGLRFGVLKNETGIPIDGIIENLPDREIVRVDGAIALKVT